MHFLNEVFTTLVHGCAPFALMYQIYSDTGFLAARNEMMPRVMQEVQDKLIRWILKDEKRNR